MKKRLLSALLSFCVLLTLLPVVAQAGGDQDKRTVPLSFSVVTSSEPIESAFTDTAFLAAVRELIGKTQGEHIYRSDVESITELNISRLDIESLDGIEYFEALTELICYDNAFVTLDLSHNPNLEVLDCSYGEFLTSIDVSNCPELRELDCNNTEIERLDLRQNPKLRTLYAYETQLRTLNTSNNVLLETMEVWGGHLVNLDVSNNTALKFLDCSYNNMTSSDSIIGLADCTALEMMRFSPQDTRAVTKCFTDENFLSAVREVIEKPSGDIYAEDLVEITDLAVNNSGLTSLDGIEFMSSLQTLDCTSNHLDKLDLYSNKALTTLRCADNDIAELDLSGNAALLTLNAAHNLMTNLDVSNSVALNKVDVTDNLLTNLDVSKNPELYFLECAKNKLTGLDLSNNPELAYLQCYENYMDTETPDHSIVGLEALRDKLGPPLSKDVTEENYFAYYPQLGAVPTPTPTPTPTDAPTQAPTDAPTDAPTPTPTPTPSPSASTRPAGGGSSGGGGGSIPKPAQSQPTPTPTPSAAEPIQPQELVWNPFEDVKLGDWFYQSVKYVYEKALMEGTSGTTFSPNVDTTRAMIATLLWRMEGSPAPTGGTDFPDVSDGQWYTDAVCWAASAEVVKGYDSGSFGPGDTITREQLALMLYRYAKASEREGNLTAFTDGDSVSDWAVEAMGWAVGQGIVTGKSGKRLDPQGTATRAEVAAVLQRFLK